MRETKLIDGEEHYQLGITEEWVPTHPVPDLHRGLKFYSRMDMSPCFIVEGNDPKKLERYATHIPGGIPDRDEFGEYWLLYIPSSGSDPLRWRRGEDIREQFQCGQFQLEPTKMPKGRGRDTEAWWQPIIEDDMTDYEFIDPDQPEQRTENNSDYDSDKVAGGNSIVNRLKTAIGGFLQ